jgi:hypothetical protein
VNIFNYILALSFYAYIHTDTGGKKLFSFSNIEIKNNNTVAFRIINGSKKNLYTIEQLRWNNWEPVKTLESDCDKDTCDFFATIETMHSGLNRFRIKMESDTQFPVYSQSVSFYNKANEVKHFDKKHEVILSKITEYRLYTHEGILIKKAINCCINKKELNPGKYKLLYDNKTVYFKVK